MENNIWEPNVLVRYTHPTKFEIAPYGTIWKAMEDDKHMLFIQLGKEENVNWVKMGDFLEGIFGKIIGEEEFIEGCLYLFESTSDKEYKDLISGLGVKLEHIGEKR
jgi:hypothetical protein